MAQAGPAGARKQSRETRSAAVSVAEIRAAFAERKPGGEAENPGERQAAVALVFAGDPEAPELCFIRRAERAGDRWSGQMAFPGGMRQPADECPRAAAQRETEEEVGLKLEERHYLAPLDRMAVMAGGADTGIRLFPFLFYLGAEKGVLRPNGEVAEAFWIPLAHIFDARNHARKSLHRNGELQHFPSVSFRGHHIWGVTYRVLIQFTAPLGRPLPQPPPGH